MEHSAILSAVSNHSPMQDDPEKDLFDNSNLLPAGFRRLPRTEGPCRFFMHLPNLSLGESVRIPFRGGELRSVPFDEWRALDGEIAEKRAKLYEVTRPAFFVVDEDAATERIFARVRRDAHVLFSILTLCGMRADPPGTSTAYASRGTSKARLIGVHDRRSILNGPVRWRLQVIDGALFKALSFLELHAAAFDLSEVARAVQACSLSRGDDDPIDDIMRLTVALEALMLRDVTTGITAAFVKRVGQFVLKPSEVASDLERDLRTLYALRSDALHGRDWANSLAGTCRDEAAWAAWAHDILRRAANRVVGHVGGAADQRQALETLRLSLIP